MTDFEGSRTISCRHCGRPFNTAEGPQCDCGEKLEVEIARLLLDKVDLTIYKPEELIQQEEEDDKR